MYFSTLCSFGWFAVDFFARGLHMHCCHALSVVLARLSCNVLCCKKNCHSTTGDGENAAPSSRTCISRYDILSSSLLLLQQQRRGWKVWGVTSDNVRVVKIASDSWSSAYVCIKRKYKKFWPTKYDIVARIFTTVDGSNALLYMSQWSISVQSSIVWRPIKLLPFARLILSVRDKSENCENGER